MKRSVLVMVAMATLVTAGAAQLAFLPSTVVADKNQDQGRNVTGQVMTKAEAPLPDPERCEGGTTRISSPMSLLRRAFN